MGAYVDYIGWASVTPPATSLSNLRWWNRAFVFAETRNIYSSHPLGWAAAVLADMQKEGDRPIYSYYISQKEVGTKVSVSIDGSYLGTFTWKAPRECEVGFTKCIDGDLYWCRDGIWTLQQVGAPKCIPTPPPPPPPPPPPLPPPPPPRECAVGETKCVGEDLYWCRDGIWTLQQFGAPQCIPAPPPPPTPPPPPVVCPRGDRYNIHFYQTCDPGYTKKFEATTAGYYCQCDAAPPEPVPPEPVPPEPVPPEPVPPVPPEACPRGAIYTRGLFEECDIGYYQGDIPGAGLIGMGMACLCAEEYEPPLADAFELSALIPLALIIGAVLLVLTMVKR